MSNNSIKVTLTVAPENELFARRGLQKDGRVQKYIDSEVLRCCDSYVPMLTGKLKPVSYTHLDVYKRQVLSSRALPTTPKSI